MTTSPSTASADIVERMGLLWELDGLTRIAGRIMGFLLLQPEARSLQEMATALGVSKASVSVDARRLEYLGFVERVGKPGDRRDFYAIADDMLARALALRLKSIHQLQNALVAAGEIPGTDEKVRARITKLVRVHTRVLRAIDALLDDLRQMDPSLTPLQDSGRT